MPPQYTTPEPDVVYRRRTLGNFLRRMDIQLEALSGGFNLISIKALLELRCHAILVNTTRDQERLEFDSQFTFLEPMSRDTLARYPPISRTSMSPAGSTTYSSSTTNVTPTSTNSRATGSEVQVSDPGVLLQQARSTQRRVHQVIEIERCLARPGGPSQGVGIGLVGTLSSVAEDYMWYCERESVASHDDEVLRRHPDFLKVSIEGSNSPIVGMGMLQMKDCAAPYSILPVCIGFDPKPEEQPTLTVSELRVAVRSIRFNLGSPRHSDQWLFPVLIISYFGNDRARIIQAHVRVHGEDSYYKEEAQLLVQYSQLFDFSQPNPPVQLFARYTLAKPIYHPLRVPNPTMNDPNPRSFVPWERK
ncbi:hypothetical protein BJX64DRAFT_294568 [Aspergillus heterothallicus]